MTQLLHDVRVTLADGTVVDGWESYEIQLDLLSPGSPFSFTIPDPSQALKDRLKLGTQLHVSIDGAVQLSGQIDDRDEPDEGREGESIVIGGTDLAGVAMDADADPSLQLRNSTLEQALVALFEPLGYSVFIADAASIREVQAARNRRRGTRSRRRAKPVDRLRIHPGDKIWDVADRLCRRAGYLLWTGPHPDPTAGIGVIVDKPVDTGEPTYRFERIGSFPYRGNIESGGRKMSIRGVPTDVFAFSHAPLGGAQDARFRTTVANDRLQHPLVDPQLLPRPRFYHPQGVSDREEAANLARSVIAHANGNFLVYECSVIGHAQRWLGMPYLYAINSLAHVKDDRLQIDEAMLITQVKFTGRRTGDSGGQMTHLRMVPRGIVHVTADDL